MDVYDSVRNDIYETRNDIYNIDSIKDIPIINNMTIYQLKDLIKVIDLHLSDFDRYYSRLYRGKLTLEELYKNRIRDRAICEQKIKELQYIQQ